MSVLSLLPQASRDLAQMNDLQAQLEEVNKEKQELQEKVGSIALLVERVEVPAWGCTPRLQGRKASLSAVSVPQSSIN